MPLSRAKCCRICVPESISSETSKLMPAGANATAVVSVGCHASTTKASVTCEDDPATTFVTGFQHSVLVPKLASATFYPEGPVTCCSPVLMLSTGVAFLTLQVHTVCLSRSQQIVEERHEALPVMHDDLL